MTDFREDTARIAQAYVANHQITPDQLPIILSTIHGALKTLGQEPVAEPEGRPTPAVPIKRSVAPDYLVCLEDGKKLKMLKRHLKTAYDLTPDEYRARWGLPFDYPMVAPNYAKQRSSLAKQIGLGQRGRRFEAAPAPEPVPEPVPVPAPVVAKPARRQRRKAA